MQRFHLGSTTISQNQNLMMDSSSSPLSLQTQKSPFQDPHEEESSHNKQTKKTLLSSLMGTNNNTSSTLRTPFFEEDNYFVTLLKSSEKKALQDLKKNLLEATSNGVEVNVSMWGIPLLGGDDRADVILLKFLRARDFRVNEALNMIIKCLAWRKEFNADTIVEEDLSQFKELEGVIAYMQGYDKEGHPVCYNAYGLFRDKEMYEKIFGDEEKLKMFLRWRVQVLERGIRLLHFKPGGVNSLIQVTDLKDMPKRELRVASNHIMSLFQDNYPEMVARKVQFLFITLKFCI
jgi:hypothetical protein